MITKLKANTAYKLIDKEGWFNNHPKNVTIFEQCFTKGGEVMLQSVDSAGNGCWGVFAVIRKDSELQYFEEVITTPETPEIVSEKVKPLTRTVYRKTTLSTKELLTEMLVNGKVYHTVDDDCRFSYSEDKCSFIYEDVEDRLTFKLIDTSTINTYFYELVEEEVSWQEQLCEEFDISYEEKEGTFVVHSGLSTAETIKLAKRIIELSDTK